MEGKKIIGYRRLREQDIEIGQPLRHSVHSETGALLLKKGYVIKDEVQRNKLVNQKVYIYASPDKPGSAAYRSGLARAQQEKESDRLVDVFEWVESHYGLLAIIYQEFARGPDETTRAKVNLLAERIHRAAEKHHDGLLAAIHLAEGKAYSHIKAFHVAVLCEVLGTRIGIGPAQRVSLVAAGLTHDVGMWQLQDELQLREEPLTDEQWQQIRKHPTTTVALLKKAGVVDPTWLQAVQQHHERLNGSGYPQGLKENQIAQVARVLAVADTFAAMVRQRGDRDKRLPKEALRDIFLSRGEEIDGTLAQLFIKELGMFPPGSACRLVSGEIGIAVGPGTSAAAPDVEVIFDHDGQPMKRAVLRDTTSKGFAVREIVPLPEHPARQALLAKMWDKVPKKGRL
ncbi:HD-GYP domain-containing protein [Motiliproteus sp. SC1-56]|uniref:HD-GYP domain-containing protein n=1 Tax=Motiliproteus sp. SC1-56 TaxID=2799565 RepID=UPI001A8EA68A|nr:HD domain-containing phosphohydrolase [Motiliproteus sp. SC1-56]